MVGLRRLQRRVEGRVGHVGRLFLPDRRLPHIALLGEVSQLGGRAAHAKLVIAGGGRGFVAARGALDRAKIELARAELKRALLEIGVEAALAVAARVAHAVAPSGVLSPAAVPAALWPAAKSDSVCC